MVAEGEAKVTGVRRSAIETRPRVGGSSNELESLLHWQQDWAWRRNYRPVMCWKQLVLAQESQMLNFQFYDLVVKHSHY